MYCSYKYLSLTIAMGLFFTGCKKFVEIDPAPEIISANAGFENDKTALAAVGGVYANMRSANLWIQNGDLSIFTSLSADEIFNTTSNTTPDPFYQNALVA